MIPQEPLSSDSQNYTNKQTSSYSCFDSSVCIVSWLQKSRKWGQEQEKKRTVISVEVGEDSHFLCPRLIAKSHSWSIRKLLGREHKCIQDWDLAKPWIWDEWICLLVYSKILFPHPLYNLKVKCQLVFHYCVYINYKYSVNKVEIKFN